MRLFLSAIGILMLAAPAAGERAEAPSAAQVAAVEALLPAAQRRESASCVRTCRASAKQEYGVCRNAYPGNKDLCLVVREQRIADCPSICGPR